MHYYYVKFLTVELQVLVQVSNAARYTFQLVIVILNFAQKSNNFNYLYFFKFLIYFVFVIKHMCVKIIWNY